MSHKKILVLGASGYIGSNLVEELLNRGYQVRAAARSVQALKKYPWANHPQVEFFEADVLNQGQLRFACENCTDVFYLIHSMNPQHKDFAQADRQAAQNMVSVAKATNIKRIIYLGGLGEQEGTLSEHLRSRLEVARILHAGDVPVTTLRAAMIIGRGSISFKILSTLVDRLPVLVTPRWVETESQPIAIKNVISYLIGCLEREYTAGEIYDIGGPDIVSYRKLFDIYAEEKGTYKRVLILVPFFKTRLSSYWIQFVTGVPSYLVRPLSEGLRNRMVCQENRIRELIPQELLDCRHAMRLAIHDKKSSHE